MRSFSRTFERSIRSFRSTNGAAAFGSAGIDCFLGAGAKVKSVTRFKPTGFPTLLRFFVTRIFSLEVSRGKMGERFPSLAAFASSLCRAAFDRSVKGRSRSSWSSEEHEGLEISSLIGDENGKFGTGTWRAWGFRLSMMV